MCFCHRAVYFDTGFFRAVMICGWEGDLQAGLQAESNGRVRGYGPGPGSASEPHSRINYIFI